MLSNELRQRIRDSVAEPVAAGTQAARKKPIRFRRLALTAAAACLVLVFSMGALAGAFPSFERFIAQMNEQGVSNAEALMQPVNIGSADADTGIGMEVLAAVNDGEAAVVYLALADNGTGLIDETTELYDIEISGTMMQWGQMAYFDEEMDAAIFKLEGSGQQVKTGEAITVTVHSILTGVEEFSRLDTGLSLADITTLNAAPAYTTNSLGDSGWPMGSFGVSYGEEPAAAEALLEQHQAGQLPILTATEAPIVPQNADWIEITAAGVVDDFLHVQYRAATDAGRYGRTGFELVWPGSPSEPYMPALAVANLGLGQSEQVGYYQLFDSYENILELPAEVPAEEVRLVMNGSRCDARIEGNWSVSFVLDDAPPSLGADCHIDLGGVVIDRLLVSPIGVTAFGRGEYTEHSQGLIMEVFLKDGTVVPIEAGFSSTTYSEEGGDMHVIRDCFLRPIDLDELDRLVVNGQVIRLQPV